MKPSTKRNISTAPRPTGTRRASERAPLPRPTCTRTRGRATGDPVQRRWLDGAEGASTDLTHGGGSDRPGLLQRKVTTSKETRQNENFVENLSLKAWFGAYIARVPGNACSRGGYRSVPPLGASVRVNRTIVRSWSA